MEEAAIVTEVREPAPGQGKDKMKIPDMITPKSQASVIRDTVKTDINTEVDAEQASHFKKVIPQTGGGYEILGLEGSRSFSGYIPEFYLCTLCRL